MKKLSIVVFFLFLAVGTAQAQGQGHHGGQHHGHHRSGVNWVVGFGGGQVWGVVGPPVYYAPAPMYYAPAPVPTYQERLPAVQPAGCYRVNQYFPDGGYVGNTYFPPYTTAPAGCYR